MTFKTHLITLVGSSGKQYALSFECEDSIDAETMMRDCELTGNVDGQLYDSIPWEDMPEIRNLQ